MNTHMNAIIRSGTGTTQSCGRTTDGSHAHHKPIQRRLLCRRTGAAAKIAVIAKRAAIASHQSIVAPESYENATRHTDFQRTAVTRGTALWALATAASCTRKQCLLFPTAWLAACMPTAALTVPQRA